MFTTRFFILLAVCIVVAVVGIVWPVCYYAALVCVSVLALATIGDIIILLLTAYRFSARREFTANMSMLQPNRVSVTVELGKPPVAFTNVSLNIYDTAPDTFRIIGEAGSTHVGTFSYNVMPTARGRYEFGPVRCFVTTKFPGLCRGRRFVRTDSMVMVYPTYRNLRDSELKASEYARAGEKRMRRAGNSTAFDSIRAYVPGDDIRNINWRATARTNNLLVNVYTDERSADIIPVVSAGPSMLVAYDDVTLLDRAVSAAVSLAHTAIRHYDRAGLITLTHTGVQSFLQPDRAPVTMSRILAETSSFGLPPTPSEMEFVDDPDVRHEGIDARTHQGLLQRIEACRADADYFALAAYVNAHLPRRSLLVLFANFENLEVANMVLPALQRISRRHKLVVVIFENESIDDTARQPYLPDAKVSNSLVDQRLRTLCAAYIEQQQLMAAAMRKAGINVILTRPGNLTTAVLAKYLDLKARAVV